MTADMPAKLTRVRDHSTSVADWLDGNTDVLDLDVVSETVEFTPGTNVFPLGPPHRMPPVGWVPVDDNIGTPVFDSVNADCQPGRTPKGRISRKPPRLPYTGGVAYQVFVDGSRDDHSSYHGGRR
jgi:hypothetical protein